MWIYQLTTEDKHDREYQHFLTYEDALVPIMDHIEANRSTHITNKKDQEEFQKLIDNEEWSDVIEAWGEYSGTWFVIDEYEVQGSTETAERRNVHAVLSHLTSAVLDEHVHGLELKWSLGETIEHKIICIPQVPADMVTFQLTLPGADPELPDDMEWAEPESEEPE
jgi:hypothetical protein